MTLTYQLRDPIRLLKKFSETDGFGGVKMTWQETKTIWGKVKFVNYHKILQGSHAMIKRGLVIKDNLIFQIFLRPRTDLTVSDKLIWKKKLLHIISDPISTDNNNYITVFACQNESEYLGC